MRTEDSDRWQRLDKLLEAALKLPTAERAAFLDEACGDDAELRAELAELLRQEPSVADFLEEPALEVVARAAEAERKMWQRGERIGHYRIEERLGAGGMGEVYLAHDERLDRRVAIKILPAEFTSDPSLLRRFGQEARTASSLNHPNIITVYEIGQHEEVHYIAYELVEGRTLRERIRESEVNQSEFDWRETVSVGAQVAAALRAAHRAGIIHRDIKPENVMLRADGLVKVLDFGIAKRFDVPLAEERISSATAATNATQVGQIFGTIGYLSPEQARGEAVDARTDIFSLGLVLYEMLGGHPFGGRPREEKLKEVASDKELPPIGERRKNIPAALEAIVTKATAKSRDARYSSAGEMLDALDELRPPIETKTTEKAQKLLARGSANRLLNQFVALYAADKTTRLSPATIWAIWRYSDIKRGRLEAELLRKSLISALSKVGLIALLAGLLTFVIAAWFSVEEKWEERQLRDGHAAGVRRAAFSPNGKWLVSVSEDHQVLVWDFVRRELKQRLTGHTGWVVAVAFTPDGKHFATASWDQTVIVWDAESLAKVVVLREQRAPITGVAFSPDGKYLAAASNPPDNRTILWDARRWVKVRELPLEGGDWGPLLFSPINFKLLLAGAKACNVETGREVVRLVKIDGSGVAFSPDGLQLVVAESNGQVTFADSAQQRRLGEPIQIHRDHGRAAAFSPDGKLVATGSEDIALWNAATRELITRWDHTSYVWGLVFSPDNRYLVSTHGDGSILLWDMVGRERVANLKQHSHPVTAVASMPDGGRIVSGSEDRSVIVWNATTGRKEAVLLGHHSRIVAVALSPDGQWAASLDQANEMIRWDITARQPRWRRKTYSSKSLTISPDGRWVANGSGVYDNDTGEPIFNYDRDWCNYNSVSFSADGRRLAAVGYWQVYLWDTQKWRLIGQAQTPRDEISVSLSPDGQQLVTGNIAGEVTLWQAQPLRSVAVIGRHAARVKQVAFASDNRRVASVGDDNKLKLWDAGARELVQEIGTHTAPVLAVAFARDGRQIVTGEHDKSVRVYTRRRSLWGWPWD